MHPDLVRDLPQHLQHRRLAVARSEEEGKQLDRPVDGPVDIFVKQWLDVGELALVDRAMQRA